LAAGADLHRTQIDVGARFQMARRFAIGRRRIGPAVDLDQHLGAAGQPGTDSELALHFAIAGALAGNGSEELREVAIDQPFERGHHRFSSRVCVSAGFDPPVDAAGGATTSSGAGRGAPDLFVSRLRAASTRRSAMSRAARSPIEAKPGRRRRSC